MQRPYYVGQKYSIHALCLKLITIHFQYGGLVVSTVVTQQEVPGSILRYT